MVDIYDKRVWKRLIEKYGLKDLAIELNVYENPQDAKKMMETLKKKKLSQKQEDFCNQLIFISFIEQHFINMIISNEAELNSNGTNDYESTDIEKLILIDFEISFQDFIYECEKRGKKGKIIENIKFSEAYQIFLEVIQLKMKYKKLFTKLFVRKMMEISPKEYKKKNAIEIKRYFLQTEPTMLSEILDELV